MSPSQLERLDALAASLRGSRARREADVLSTGERIYVALAADRVDLISDFTIVEALDRLGPNELVELIKRWR